VVTLGGVNDVSRLSHALEQMDGVLLVDNVSAMSELFGRYVASAIRGLVIAFVLITLLMVSRFGLLQGTALVVVPLLSGALSLLCLGALNQPLNLFHIVGVALILGTGMDYALFLRSGRGRPETMLAVLLAAITTECAFGLLGLSQVRAIHSFGLTVALGTAWSFLLAPVVVKRTRTMAAQLTP
jgi:predicted exporter